MKFTRRNFIKTGSLSAIGLVGLASSPSQIFGAKSSGAFQTDALYLQSSESFQKLIGTKFTIYCKDFAISSELQDVRKFSSKDVKTAGRRRGFGKTNAECFSLIFLLPTEDLTQDVYSMFHPTIGQFDLLLVPSKNEQNEPTFTAVINRI